MTPEQQKLISNLETKVRQILEQYTLLSKENDELKSVIAEKNSEIARLEGAYNTLKLAKMIDIGDRDIKNAKSRISKLVREVDKCIALLNV